MFPHRIIAGMRNFKERECFEADEGEKEDVNGQELFQGNYPARRVTRLLCRSFTSFRSKE